jgi:putative PIN family toxin of toxin-antitoxin system
MRVLCDTNILISYLLSSENTGTIVKVVESAYAGDYTLVLPAEVIEELRRKVAEKAWLAARIPPETAETFITALTAIAFLPGPITEPLPQVGRDRKDDYLLAYGAVAACDYLVTGDPDL